MSKRSKSPVDPSLYLDEACPDCQEAKGRVRTLRRRYFVQCFACGSKTGLFKSQELALAAWTGDKGPSIVEDLRRDLEDPMVDQSAEDLNRILSEQT